MTADTRSVDHFVYAVPDLEAAMEDFGRRSGITPTFGGFHTHQGTKNALVALGAGCYLEFLAVDPENTTVAAPRWMGVDRIDGPTLTRWALQSDDLERDAAAVAEYRPEMGRTGGGERRTAAGDLLAWRMVLPLAEPAVELVPFMVDWRGSAVHPTQRLPAGCTFETLQLTHPRPEAVRTVLRKLGVAYEVRRGEAAKITVNLRTPRGPLSL